MSFLGRGVGGATFWLRPRYSLFSGIWSWTHPCFACLLLPTSLVMLLIMCGEHNPCLCFCFSSSFLLGTVTTSGLDWRIREGGLDGRVSGAVDNSAVP